MSNDVVLPNKYALVLLRKLADDDLYRHHYELNPAQALKDIGVPDDLLSQVPPENLRPTRLADKSVFLEALMLLIDELVCVTLCLVAPQIHVFAPVQGRDSRVKVPFERQARDKNKSSDITPLRNVIVGRRAG